MSLPSMGKSFATASAGGALRVWFDGTQAQKFLLKTIPRIANQETNRAYRRIGKEFGTVFTATRLIPGIFHPHRKVKMGRNPPRQPALPTKMRKAGFKAVLGGQSRLQGKYLSIYTKNPLLVMREKGEPINAPKGGWLYIRSDPKDAFKGRGAKKRRARWASWAAKKSKQKFVQGQYLRPITAKVKHVKPFPHLGFENTWRAFTGRRMMIERDIPRRIALRANVEAKRLKAA